MKIQASKPLISLALIAMLALLLSVIVLIHFWLAPHILVRHVNPVFEVEQHPLPSFIVLLYLSTVDGIIEGDYKAVIKGLEALNSAYVPEGLKFIANRFHDLLNATWKLVNETRTLLDRAEALINLGRGIDAKPLLQEALTKYEQARSTYVELESASRELVRAFGLPADELLKKIKELGEAIEELYLMITKLLEVIDLQQQLKDTFLVIDAEPKYVWTGGSIEVRGKLYAAGEGPLSGKLVRIHVDGVELAEAETLEDGLFIANIDLPYVYKPKIVVQAQYIPQGMDCQLYKPTVSNDVVIRLLYVQPKITFKVIGEALPSKFLTIQGRVESEAPLPYSQVSVLWVGSSLVADLINGSFSLRLHVPEDVAEGSYPLVVRVPAFKVYAPAQEVVYVNITRIPLDARLQIPSIMIAGLPTTIRGEVLHEGEILNVSVKVVISSQAYTTTSSREFNLWVAPPLTILTGHHNCEVYVLPAAPWYREAYFREGVLIINPLTLTLAIGLATALGIKLSRSRGAKHELAPSPELEKVKPKIVREEHFASSRFEWLVDLYWQAVVIVAKLTGVEMEPSMTMREYLASVSSRLGDLSKVFETLTIAAEKALYAHTVTIEELGSAKEAFEVIKLAGIETQL